MKKIRAVVAVLLALLMFCSTALAVQFPDVDETTVVGKAVDYLSDFGILGGYEDGNFWPDRTITRAQFAKIVYLMENQRTVDTTAEAYKGFSLFFDVKRDAWYCGYINWAALKGIVGGMGDYTFQPDGTLTYAQAIKMYVVAAGIDDKGFRYPDDYIAKAEELKILSNLNISDPNAPASRGDVAVMGYNKMVFSSEMIPGKVPGYSVAPIVPDFGAMLGIEPLMEEETEDGWAFGYFLDGKYPFAKADYLLELVGKDFRSIGSDSLEDGTPIHIYAFKGNPEDWIVGIAINETIGVVYIQRP